MEQMTRAYETGVPAVREGDRRPGWSTDREGLGRPMLGLRNPAGVGDAERRDRAALAPPAVSVSAEVEVTEGPFGVCAGCGAPRALLTWEGKEYPIRKVRCREGHEANEEARIAIARSNARRHPGTRLPYRG